MRSFKISPPRDVTRASDLSNAVDSQDKCCDGAGESGRQESYVIESRDTPVEDSGGDSHGNGGKSHEGNSGGHSHGNGGKCHKENSGGKCHGNGGKSHGKERISVFLPSVNLLSRDLRTTCGFMVDSGSGSNLIKQRMLKDSIVVDKEIKSDLRGISPEIVTPLGTVEIEILGKRTSFQVIEDTVEIPFDGILGTPFLKERKAEIKYGKNLLICDELKIPFAAQERVQVKKRTVAPMKINVANAEERTGYVPLHKFDKDVYLGEAVVSNEHGQAYLRVVNASEEDIDIEIPTIELEEYEIIEDVAEKQAEHTSDVVQESLCLNDGNYGGESHGENDDIESRDGNFVNGIIEPPLCFRDNNIDSTLKQKRASDVGGQSACARKRDGFPTAGLNFLFGQEQACGVDNSQFGQSACVWKRDGFLTVEGSREALKNKDPVGNITEVREQNFLLTQTQACGADGKPVRVRKRDGFPTVESHDENSDGNSHGNKGGILGNFGGGDSHREVKINIKREFSDGDSHGKSLIEDIGGGDSHREDNLRRVQSSCEKHENNYNYDNVTYFSDEVLKYDRVRAVLGLLRLNHLNEEEKENIKRLIEEYVERFQLPDEQLCVTNAIEHAIPLMDDRPVHTKQYRFPPMHKLEIDRQVNELLNNDLIEQSTSPYSSPVWIVPKKPDVTSPPRTA